MAVTQKEKDYIDSLKNSENKEETNTVTDKLIRSEREINIIYNEEDGYWIADTSIPKFWRRLEKKNWKCILINYYPDGTVCSKTFISNSPKGITITDPTKKRELTDEQRQAIRDRFTKSSEEVENESE